MYPKSDGQEPSARDRMCKARVAKDGRTKAGWSMPEWPRPGGRCLSDRGRAWPSGYGRVVDAQVAKAGPSSGDQGHTTPGGLARMAKSGGLPQVAKPSGLARVAA